MVQPTEPHVTILVPLDGSSFGEAILGTVQRLARPLGARVELLLVAAPALDPATPLPAARGVLRPAAPTGSSPGGALRRALADPDAAYQGRERAVAAVLDAYLGRCAAALAGVETRRVVEFADDPAAVIIERARHGHVDLIAMATHGRTGRMQHLTGSVTARVIRSGVAPVVVLRP